MTEAKETYLREHRSPRPKGLHRRGLGEARAVHGRARTEPRLRSRRRLPRAERREARSLQRAHHRDGGDDRRPRRHRARRRRMRRSADGAGSARGAPVRLEDGAGGPRSRTRARAPGVLVRVAHHARRPGPLLATVPDGGEGRRLVCPAIRYGEIDDQVLACRRIFESDRLWTVVRGSALEEGESQGLPVWSRHVGDPILESNITRRVDFARFMVDAIDDDALIHEAPAIVGCQTPSALEHAYAPALRRAS